MRSGGTSLPPTHSLPPLKLSQPLHNFLHLNPLFRERCLQPANNLLRRPAPKRLIPQLALFRRNRLLQPVEFLLQSRLFYLQSTTSEYATRTSNSAVDLVAPPACSSGLLEIVKSEINPESNYSVLAARNRISRHRVKARYSSAAILFFGSSFISALMFRNATTISCSISKLTHQPALFASLRPMRTRSGELIQRNRLRSRLLRQLMPQLFRQKWHERMQHRSVAQSRQTNSSTPPPLARDSRSVAPASPTRCTNRKNLPKKTGTRSAPLHETGNSSAPHSRLDRHTSQPRKQPLHPPAARCPFKRIRRPCPHLRRCQLLHRRSALPQTYPDSQTRTAPHSKSCSQNSARPPAGRRTK